MHVEAVSRDRLLGARTASRSVARFEHEHVPARAGEIAGGDETVVAGAHDDDRRRHGQLGERALGPSTVVVGGIGPLIFPSSSTCEGTDVTTVPSRKSRRTFSQSAV